MDINLLEKDLQGIKEIREKAWKAEKILKERLLELERETFNGKTYSEYINLLCVDEEKEGVKIRIRQYALTARYELNGVTLTCSTTVYQDSIIHVEAEYPNKTLFDVPKKYSKEELHLIEVCKSYRIVNPSKRYREKYRIMS